MMWLDTKTFRYCPFCGQKLTFTEEDGMFDGKGSSFCPNCGLINRIKPLEKKKEEKTTMINERTLKQIIDKQREALHARRYHSDEFVRK